MISACFHLPTVRRRCPHHERVRVRITGSKASVWTAPACHPCVLIFQTGLFPVSSHCESWLIVSLVNSFWIIYCSEKKHQMSQWLTYGNFKWALDWLLFLPLGPESKDQTIYHLRPVDFFTVRSGPFHWRGTAMWELAGCPPAPQARRWMHKGFQSLGLLKLAFHNS